GAAWDGVRLGCWRAAGNSLRVAGTAALTTVGVGLALVYARRLSGNRLARSVVRLASLGYAMPGTVLALGLMLPLAMLDNAVDAGLRAWLGVSSGLILSGSLFVIVLAYTVRFLAIALGSIEAGFDKLSPNLDAVARTLGESALSCLRRVHVPLLLPALAAAALMVFVDGMKELPATLLLRPFNFGTLAAIAFTYPALRQFCPAPAVRPAPRRPLALLLMGLVRVLGAHPAGAGGRAGSKAGADGAGGLPMRR